MTWVRLEDKRAVHPKMLQAGLLATGLDTVAICWCALHSSDGFITETEARMLWDLYGENAGGKHGQRRYKDCLSNLVTVGRWVPVPERQGYEIHDFLDYNPSRADQDERRRKTREKVANWRSRNPVSNPVTDDDVTLPPTRPDPYRAKALLSEIGGNPVTTAGSNGHKTISDPAVLELCDFLALRVGQYRGGEERRPRITAQWKKDMDLLVRLGPGGRAKSHPLDPAVIRRCITYVFDELAEPQGPGAFSWAKNIASPGKLREQWDKLAKEKSDRDAKAAL